MIVLYGLSLILLGTTILFSVRRSEYGVLILVAETPFVVGLCLYPILLEVGAVLPGIEGQSYLDVNGLPGWGAALHILFYSIFAVAGYLGANRSTIDRPNFIARALSKIAEPETIWHFLVLFGLIVYATFLFIVGPEVALINAARARSGDFEGFEGSEQFLFLKTLASLSVYAACFVPYLLLRHRGGLFLVLYIALTVIGYLNSISRNLILYQLILPLLIAMRAQGLNKSNLFVLVTLIVPIALLVLFFGKPFGHLASAFIARGEIIEVLAYQGEEGLWNAVLRNYESIWFSVDAGWQWFVREGPIVPQDALAAIGGFIPSRILDGLGIGWLYHGNAEIRMACINSAQFGLDNCTVPPLITGLAAYMAPIAGAAIGGFLKFFVYGRLERLWLYYKNVDYSRTWIPYFLFLLWMAFTSFIPNSIALASFAFLMFFLAFSVKTVARLTKGQSSLRHRDVDA